MIGLGILNIAPDRCVTIHVMVTRAVQIMPSLGFTNMLNVGHNHIFERTIP